MFVLGGTVGDGWMMGTTRGLCCARLRLSCPTVSCSASVASDVAVGYLGHRMSGVKEVESQRMWDDWALGVSWSLLIDYRHWIGGLYWGSLLWVVEGALLSVFFSVLFLVLIGLMALVGPTAQRLLSHYTVPYDQVRIGGSSPLSTS